MREDFALQVSGLGKCYHMYSKPQDRLKQMFFGHFKKFYKEFWALKDISFQVKQGESFGVIGHNGAGKSTLLQLICKTLTPTTGDLIINGKVAALLELGAGFNPEFTGRENVYMNGAILGFSRKEIDKRFDEIEAFADIGDFIDQPVKTYSSGMYVRLAFAVQVCVEPDILVVDEALSVGDIFFQQKCYTKIKQMIAKGTTCFFVSHDTAAILNLCDRVLLLKNGQAEFCGDPEEAVSRYYTQLGKPSSSKTNIDKKWQLVAAKQDSDIELFRHNILENNTKRHGAQGLEIIAANVTNLDESYTLETPILQSLNFNMLLRAHKHIDQPVAGIHIFDKFSNLVFAAGTRQLQYALPSMQPNQEIIVIITVTFSVQAGEYTFSLGAAESLNEVPNVGFTHDRHEMLGPIVVTADQNRELPFYGIAQLPTAINSIPVTKGN